VNAAPTPTARQVLLCLLILAVCELPKPPLPRKPAVPVGIGEGHFWDEYHLLLGLDAGHSPRDAAGWFAGDWPEHNGYWRPLTAVSLWLDYLLWGGTAAVTSSRASCCTCAPSWRWCIWGAASLAALRGASGWDTVHAGSERRLPGDPHAFLRSHRWPVRCVLLACLYFALRFMRTRSVASLLLMALSGAGALMSKEMAVTLPLTVALCWLVAAQRPPFRRLLPLVAAAALLVIGWYLAYRGFVPLRLTGTQGTFHLVPTLLIRLRAALWPSLRARLRCRGRGGLSPWMVFNGELWKTLIGLAAFVGQRCPADPPSAPARPVLAALGPHPVAPPARYLR